MHRENLNFEIKRKLFHLSSLWLPILYYFIDIKTIMIKIITIITLLIVTVDYLRAKILDDHNFINKFFAIIMREAELKYKSLTGASYFLLGGFLTIFIFSQNIAIIALFILIICDSCAAIIGKTIGSIRINSKTIEGAAGFFLSGLIVLWVLSKFISFDYFYANISLFITAIMELYAKKIKIDDNFLIPLSFGFAYELLMQL